jgi:hypothetical protein
MFTPVEKLSQSKQTEPYYLNMNSITLKLASGIRTQKILLFDQETPSSNPGKNTFFYQTLLISQSNSELTWSFSLRNQRVKTKKKKNTKEQMN